MGKSFFHFVPDLLQVLNLLANEELDLSSWAPEIMYYHVEEYFVIFETLLKPFALLLIVFELHLNEIRF